MKILTTASVILISMGFIVGPAESAYYPTYNVRGGGPQKLSFGATLLNDRAPWFQMHSSVGLGGGKVGAGLGRAGSFHLISEKADFSTVGLGLRGSALRTWSSSPEVRTYYGVEFTAVMFLGVDLGIYDKGKITLSIGLGF